MTYRAEKQEYEVPCDHPMCPVLHRHLAQYRYDTPEWEEYVDAHGITRQVRSTHWHMKMRREWVVIDEATDKRADGELSDAFDTRRDALAAIEREEKYQERRRDHGSRI